MSRRFLVRKLPVALVLLHLLVIGTYIMVNSNRRSPKETLVLKLGSKHIQDQLSNDARDVSIRKVAIVEQHHEGILFYSLQITVI